MAWIAAMEAVHRLLVEASLRKEMWKNSQIKTRPCETGHESTGPSEGVGQSASSVSCNLVDHRFKRENWVTDTSQMETKNEELITMTSKVAQLQC